MPKIVVTAEQARTIAEATELVEILDERGRHLGYVSRDFTEEDIEIAKRRITSNEPRFTTQQVLDHLRSLG